VRLDTSLFLYDHLGYALTAQGLATDERLVLDSRKQITESREHEKDRSRDQAGPLRNCAQPLDETHHTVDGGAHVVRGDFANRGIERGRCRTDSQQEGHLNEEDDEGGRPINDQISNQGSGSGLGPTNPS
jgi:hypothetical protein